MTPSILLIGYGNTLRRDDGLGRRIAEEVDRRAYPGVRSISRGQLTSDLAENLAACELAVFVDASRECASEEPMVEPLEPACTTHGALDHAIGPRFLLALCRVLYNRCPQAWLIWVPAADFSFGNGLSPLGARGMERALVAVERLITDAWRPEPLAPAPCPMGDPPSFPPTSRGPRP
jgi:hydrogenase maturation protease